MKVAHHKQTVIKTAILISCLTSMCVYAGGPSIRGKPGLLLAKYELTDLEFRYDTHSAPKEMSPGSKITLHSRTLIVQNGNLKYKDWPSGTDILQLVENTLGGPGKVNWQIQDSTMITVKGKAWESVNGHDDNSKWYDETVSLSSDDCDGDEQTEDVDLPYGGALYIIFKCRSIAQF